MFKAIVLWWYLRGVRRALKKQEARELYFADAFNRRRGITAQERYSCLVDETTKARTAGEHEEWQDGYAKQQKARAAQMLSTLVEMGSVRVYNMRPARRRGIDYGYR